MRQEEDSDRLQAGLKRRPGPLPPCACGILYGMAGYPPFPPDLPKEHVAARKAAIAKMAEIAANLSDVDDHSAAETVRLSINSVAAAQPDARPPVPAADPPFPPDAPESHLAARKDAIVRLREIAANLSDVGDHNAAEKLLVSIRFVAQPTFHELR